MRKPRSRTKDQSEDTKDQETDKQNAAYGTMTRKRKSTTSRVRHIKGALLVELPEAGDAATAVAAKRCHCAGVDAEGQGAMPSQFPHGFSILLSFLDPLLCSKQSTGRRHSPLKTRAPSLVARIQHQDVAAGDGQTLGP